MLNRSILKKSVTVLLVVLGVMAFSQAPVSAIMLEFDDMNVTGGTLTYDGNGGSLYGSDILFDTITGVGTPTNDGVQLSITDGVLNFQTGSNTAEGPSPNTWTFAPGGSFVLSGTVMDGSTQIATGALITGTFTDSYVAGSQYGVIFSGMGIDTKNSDLLRFYGIDTDLADLFRFLNTEISATVTDFDAVTGAFEASVNNADIVNSVPDASIMFLLAPCLIGLGIVGRRKARS